MRAYRLRPIPPEADPQMREMLGVARGIVCDGSCTDAELLALRQWLVSNSAVLDREPGLKLGSRLIQACEDGHIDEAERLELTSILRSLLH